MNEVERLSLEARIVAAALATGAAMAGVIPKPLNLKNKRMWFAAWAELIRRHDPTLKAVTDDEMLALTQAICDFAAEKVNGDDH